MEYVTALENRDNRTRGQIVLAALKELAIEPVVPMCPWPRIRNIIVDFSPESREQIVFSAHYDAVKGSPGANDNASGVAVLLGLCRELRHAPAPVRVIFFDREEAWLRTPWFRLGVLGSLYYVGKSDRRRITAVFNLEFCGCGEFLAIWPVTAKEARLSAVKQAQQAATRLGIPFKSAHLPWFLISSDHLAFRFKGIANALTLSLVPARQIPLLEKLLSDLRFPKVLFRRLALPEPLSVIHTSEDTSSRLREEALRRMLSLVRELAQSHALAETSRHFLPRE